MAVIHWKTLWTEYYKIIKQELLRMPLVAVFELLNCKICILDFPQIPYYSVFEY